MIPEAHVDARRRAPHGRAGLVFAGCVAAGALALAAAGCGSAGKAAEPSAQVTNAPTVGTSSKVAVRAPAPRRAGTPGRYPPPRLTPPARPGQVLVEDGPFIQRLRLKDLALRSGSRPVASGAIQTSVEDSELLGIELEVDFYDAQGRFVGKGTRSYGPGPSLSGEPQKFTVRAARAAPTATSALLVVLNFVND